ncbi:glycoside hydrolase family 26 protein [Nucisporomicrobium flavum]|uniref:glycoside hydrolase family 26 protein n=1 Tax=Nucisporomicrobium flavum TaxID=2785915 RepID=UPI003C2F45CE
MRTRHLLIGSVMSAVAVLEFAIAQNITFHAAPAGPGKSSASGAAAPAPLPPVYDIKPLLRPKGKFLGVSLGGDPTAVDNVKAYAQRIGKQPNMLTIFESFDDQFAASQVRTAYQQGALPVVRWEPFNAKLADIAAGKHDAYITAFAKEIRRVNVPVAMTFAHEMNGNWYPWGAKKVKPGVYVAAWRHLHQLFEAADARNVIWTWTPNVINPVPSVKLKPLYPGDKYVDWIGIDGYYTHRGKHTYAELFGPTKRAVRRFTDKPFLIVETGGEPGSERPGWIRDLARGVARDDDMLGFVYFNQNGSARWKIDADSAAQQAMRDRVDNKTFGFTVR